MTSLTAKEILYKLELSVVKTISSLSKNTVKEGLLTVTASSLAIAVVKFGEIVAVSSQELFELTSAETI